MKKLALILSMFLISAIGFSQATPANQVRVANATTTFGVNIPIGTSVYDVNALKYYICTTGTASTFTLTTASANFQQVGGSGVYGTVTSVGSGYGLTGGPITSSGTLVADTTVLASQIRMSHVSAYPTLNQNTTGQAGKVANALTNGYGITTLTFDGSSAKTATVDTTALETKTLATSQLNTKVNKSTTITINGTAYDLTANRSWSVGTVTSVASGPMYLNITTGTAAARINAEVGIAKDSLVKMDSTATSGQIAVFSSGGKGLAGRSVASAQNLLGIHQAKVENFEQAGDSLSGHSFFTLAQTPISTATEVQLNGMTLIPTTQYTIVGTKIRVGISCYKYDKLLVSYSY